MKKILCLILVFFAVSCASKEEKNQLILPPNFSEMPDPNKPEQPTKEENDASVARLKELLLKSDE